MGMAGGKKTVFEENLGYFEIKIWIRANKIKR
jgi:hypothetical protein